MSWQGTEVIAMVVKGWWWLEAVRKGEYCQSKFDVFCVLISY